MPTEIPWAFFLCSSFRSCSLQASRSKIAEDRKTILFCFLLSIFFTWFIFGGRKRRKQQSCLLGSKIAEDRKLYVFIVTSDLLQFVSLFDLQNQDNRPGFHISRTLRCRGTEGGCKASSQKMPCTKCHLQINIESPSKVLEPRKKKHNYWQISSNALQFVKVRS